MVQPEAAPPKTVDTFEQKQKNEPSPEFVEQYNRGLDLSKSEHYLGAVTTLEKAIQIDPARAEAHYNSWAHLFSQSRSDHRGNRSTPNCYQIRPT